MHCSKGVLFLRPLGNPLRKGVLVWLWRQKSLDHTTSEKVYSCLPTYKRQHDLLRVSNRSKVELTNDDTSFEMQESPAYLSKILRSVGPTPLRKIGPIEKITTNDEEDIAVSKTMDDPCFMRLA